MSILLKIIKLPLKIIAMPAALCLLICHLACAVLIGIGSFFTNVASSLFLFGAAIEWMAGAPDVMAYQCLGLGLFFLIVPYLANCFIGRLADMLYYALDFFRR